MITQRRRRELVVQGFGDDDHLHGIAPLARLAPGACSVLAMAGIATGEPRVFFALAAVAAVGAISAKHPVDALYNVLIAPLLKTRPIPDCGAPRRFACSLAAVWLFAAGLAFDRGPSLTAALLGGVFAAATFVGATFDVCVACHLFRTMFRK